jgi:hypothetical protein
VFRARALPNGRLQGLARRRSPLLFSLKPAFLWQPASAVSPGARDGPQLGSSSPSLFAIKNAFWDLVGDTPAPPEETSVAPPPPPALSLPAPTAAHPPLRPLALSFERGESTELPPDLPPPPAHVTSLAMQIPEIPEPPEDYDEEAEKEAHAALRAGLARRPSPPFVVPARVTSTTADPAPRKAQSRSLESQRFASAGLDRLGSAPGSASSSGPSSPRSPPPLPAPASAPLVVPALPLLRPKEAGPAGSLKKDKGKY